MTTAKCLAALCAAVLMASCSGGGSSAAGGTFQLIEFLESGQDSIPRNRSLTFRFSTAVRDGQDFFECLKIENVETGPGQSNFARAIGTYVLDADRVQFTPRLPTKPDRSDAGFRAHGSYIVFLKGGPDALTSMDGSMLAVQQEFTFGTSQYFEDPIPDPPRVLGLVARDGAQTIDLSRLDPVPGTLSALDSSELIAGARVLDPGPGGAPYNSQWQFDLEVSEPIDPQTVSTENVQLVEVFSDATTTADTDPGVGAPGGHFGTPVSYPVPLQLDVVQGVNAEGGIDVVLRVSVLATLVDDTRYRLAFSGAILGIDFRKTFIGENGLTGDGQDPSVPEPGGFGYATEFIVRDRPSIAGQRMLTYDPLLDGVEPEKGQSVLDPARENSALYNPPTDPGEAVGFLADFGDGSDGPLGVGNGVVTIDTGDTPTAPVGRPFTVQDLNPNETYNKTSLATGPLTYDSTGFYTLELESLSVSSGATLRIIGSNPILIRVSGIVQISGTLDASGEAGQAGSSGSKSLGGAAGPGGSAGGESRRGFNRSFHTHSAFTWTQLLQFVPQIKSGGPYSDNGQGPGRGLRGGESFNYTPCNDARSGTTGTGGGGASHASPGERGEDRLNATGTPGTPGPALPYVHCNTKGGFRNESVIGVRGMPGPTYGDRAVIDITRGGSGGGSGGNAHGRFRATGGGGGGGGGSLTLLAAGSILVPGGTISVRGGNGGKGFLGLPISNYGYATGGGGGGSGGSLVVISGTGIDLGGGGILDARGGDGGARATVNNGQSYAGVNAGGAGGKGFLYLMDPDGEIAGLVGGVPGEYDDFSHGVLTISEFVADRFGGIAAVTELFNVGVSNPAYSDPKPGDIVGHVSKGQAIRLFASSAKGDPVQPLEADPTTESGSAEFAVIKQVAGAIVVEISPGGMALLNPSGIPDREAFARIDARFEYDDLVEAALGPFASIDRVNLNFTFN